MEGVGKGDTEGDGDRETDDDGVLLPTTEEGEKEGESEQVGVPESEGVREPEREGVLEPEAVLVTDTVAVGETEGLRVPGIVAVPVRVGVNVLDVEAPWLGVWEGVPL